MPFPLDNFEQFVDPKIEKRGYRYFMNGSIVNMEEIRSEEWKAEVQDTELYQVYAEITEQVVEKIYCSCPYDYGPVCKHQVAVLHSLRMKLLNTEPDPELHDTSRPKKSSKKTKRKTSGRKTVAEKIEEKLGQLQPEQIREFLQETLEEDRYLRSVFMARFTPIEKPQTKAAYRKQIKQILKPAKEKSRRSILYGREAYRYLEGIRELLSNIEQKLERGNVVLPIRGCQAMIEELVPAFQYIDDSDGQVGFLVDQSFELLEEAAGRSLDESTRTAFFNDCLQQFGDERYSGWDFDRQFLTLAIDLAETSGEFNQIESLLNKELNQSRKEADSDFSFSYNRERAAGQLLDLYKAADQEKKQLKFMTENRDLSNIMERLIEYAWQQKDYSSVKTYSKEAPQQFTDKPGLTANWLEWLLKVAVAENNEDKQQQYTKKLLVQTGKMGWYKKLKSQYNKEDWAKELETLQKTLQSKSRWRYSGLIPSIYIEEKQWNALFNYVQKSPDLHTLQHYDSWLKDAYFDELMELYQSAVLKYMKNNTGRKYYREVCSILQRIKALGGERTAGEVTQTLQTKYQNRPALQDELQKAELVS